MDRIGVRELRQNASAYLARVASGESIEVTDRGRPVALLVPIASDHWESMIETGRVVAPQELDDVVSEGPVDYGIDASAELAALRIDER